MSEVTPRSNPRLENFDANKTKAERDAWESTLYGEAGTTDFSDEARARVEEADTYERHMEALASDDRSTFDRNLDHFEPLTSPVEGTIEHDEEVAYAEKQAREDEEEARLAAREAKIAADPKLRRMNMLADDIANRRAALVTPENQDSAPERIAELEDKLNELLAEYEASDDYDPIIADGIIDRTVSVKSSPEVSKAKVEGETSEPKEDDKEVDSKATEDGAAEKVEDGAEHPPKIETEIEPGDDAEHPPVIDTEIEPGDGDDEEKEPTEDEKSSRVRGAMKRLKEVFTSKEKQGTRRAVAIAAGAVAIAATTVFLRYGISLGGGAHAATDHITGNGGSGTVPQGALPGHDVSPDIFSSEAHTVAEGKGWLSELNQLGIPKDQQPQVLQELLHSNDSEIQSWVYQMKDGNPGIAHTGQLPDSVLEKIQNLAHR